MVPNDISYTACIDTFSLSNHNAKTTFTVAASTSSKLFNLIQLSFPWQKTQLITF